MLIEENWLDLLNSRRNRFSDRVERLNDLITRIKFS